MNSVSITEILDYLIQILSRAVMCNQKGAYHRYEIQSYNTYMKRAVLKMKKGKTTRTNLAITISDGEISLIHWQMKQG